MNIKTAWMAASVFALGLSAPALAQDSGFSLAIETASLTTEADARDAYRDMEARIETYCSQFVAAQECTAQIMTAALEQIANDALTRIHAESQGADSDTVLTAAAYETD